MQAQAIPPLIMAGVAFYVGFYHLLVYFRRSDRRHDLTFGLTCLAVAAYDVFCAGLYNATSVSEGAWWQHAQLATLAVVALAFIWFVVDYIGPDDRRPLYLLSLCYAAFAVIQLVDRSDLTLLLEVASIKRVRLPFGLDVTYHEASPGILTNIQALVGLTLTGYVLRLAVSKGRRGQWRRAAPLIAAMVVFAAGVLNDTLVSSDVYHFVYLIEYSYLAIILLMAYSLSATVAETATALRESEEMFRSVVENAHAGILIVNDGYRFTYANGELSRILGYPQAEIIGHDFREFLDDESRSLVAERYLARQRGEEPPSRYEFTIVRKDGEKRRTEISSAVVRDATGEVRTIGQLLDVTERRRAEDALREKTAELDRYFKHALDLLCIADTDGHFRRLNQEWESALGYSIQELEGTRFLDYVHPDDLEDTQAAISKLGEQREVLNFVNRYRSKDGSYRWIEWRSSPAGKMIYAAARDITERKQVEAERERLIAELEQRNAELERFTYTVSHDLKSPLITITGFLGYLQSDLLAGETDKVQVDVERIAQAAERMDRLLQELLELSRIGRVMNPPEAVGFSAVVAEACELELGIIQGRGVAVEVASDLPEVHGDRIRLVEVVQNLIDNACRFMGDRAEPRISIGHEGRDPDGKAILFVRDNGIGIDPKHQDRVFGLFEKLDAGSEGTGIGLALVKRIVEVHGGRVWVESEPGNGSTFYFTL
jgi:PAS domain S-box-containing protein